MNKGRENNGLGLFKKAKREWVEWARIEFVLKPIVFLSFYLLKKKKNFRGVDCCPPICPGKAPHLGLF